MNTELAAEIASQKFTFTSEDVTKLFTEIQTALCKQAWQEVIDWRELGFYKLSHNYLDQAIELNLWSIQAAEALGRSDLVARYIHDLGDLQSQQGYYTEAIETYKKSFEQFEYKLGDYTSATKSLLMLALARRAIGETEKAKDLALKCIERANELNMGAWKAQPMHLLAWIARDKADYQTALEHFKLALEIHEQHHEHDRIPMMIQAHYSIARVLILSGRLSEAEKHIAAAVEWHSQISSRPIGYMAQKLCGDIAYQKRKYRIALQYYHLALDNVQAGSDERRVAECYLELAKTYFKLGSIRKTTGYVQLGISQYRRLKLLTFSRICTAIRTRFRSL